MDRYGLISDLSSRIRARQRKRSSFTLTDYPVDSTVHLLNNWCQVTPFSVLTLLEAREDSEIRHTTPCYMQRLITLILSS